MQSQKKPTRYDNPPSTLNPKTSIQTSMAATMRSNQHPKQCRICLQSEQQAPQKALIHPCRCSGSVKYVHEWCLREWIKSALSSKSYMDRMKIKAEGIQCELCKSMIRFEVRNFVGCYSVEGLGKQICERKALFIIITMLILVSLVGLGFSVYSIASNKDGFTAKGGMSFQLILSLCGASLLVIFLIIGLYTLISQIFIRKYSQIGQIRQYSSLQIFSRSNNQIIPIQEQNSLQHLPAAQFTST